MDNEMVLRALARHIRDDYSGDATISVYVLQEGPEGARPGMISICWSGPEEDQEGGEDVFETYTLDLEGADLVSVLEGHVVTWLHRHGVHSGLDDEVLDDASSWGPPDFPRSTWTPLPEDDQA
jgi:hypothetical protein